MLTIQSTYVLPVGELNTGVTAALFPPQPHVSRLALLHWDQQTSGPKFGW